GMCLPLLPPKAVDPLPFRALDALEARIDRGGIRQTLPFQRHGAAKVLPRIFYLPLWQARQPQEVVEASVLLVVLDCLDEIRFRIGKLVSKVEPHSSAEKPFGHGGIGGCEGNRKIAASSWHVAHPRAPDS